MSDNPSTPPGRRYFKKAVAPSRPASTVVKVEVVLSAAEFRQCAALAGTKKSVAQWLRLLMLQTIRAEDPMRALLAESRFIRRLLLHFHEVYALTPVKDDDELQALVTEFDRDKWIGPGPKTRRPAATSDDAVARADDDATG